MTLYQVSFEIICPQEKTEGWDVWGDEVESDIELKSN